jgi:hypothetical protein
MLEQNIEPDSEGNNYRAPSSSRGDLYHSFLGKVTQNIGSIASLASEGRTSSHRAIRTVATTAPPPTATM